MLQVEGVNIEYPQIGREPQMGYTEEYVEKTMISGKIRRIYRGKRFNATFSYAFLTSEQITTIRQLMSAQRQRGYLDITINSPFGDFSGQAVIDLNSNQTRYKKNPDTGEFVWTNWQLSVIGTEYAEE